ncbi:hypothetical protein M9H77_30355 [Catharanthus roseus]|uniref:Uncharacterized protein n=1 Tax=Catharanthus roseus TaxID=4058 RepID=A0ACC0A197_CATRO|nr:hypothetical protein M9H77_30355 [Catharanthus roseus]
MAWLPRVAEHVLLLLHHVLHTFKLSMGSLLVELELRLDRLLLDLLMLLLVNHDNQEIVLLTSSSASTSSWSAAWPAYYPIVVECGVPPPFVVIPPKMALFYGVLRDYVRSKVGFS